MVVSSSTVVWHELECGAYRADLPLWRELAGSSAADGEPAGILDVGAGTGRVALDLARAGHRVTAVDFDAELLHALSERSADVDVECVCADARTLDVAGEDFDLCLMPMQTVQLLGGTAGRAAFLARARAHLRPGGLLAVAIVTAVEPFDCARGDEGPSPETAWVDGVIHVTRAIRVCVLEETILIERERRIDAGGEPERDVIELDRVSGPQLEHEAAQTGFHPEFARELRPTRDHVGSTVVMLRA
jgi:SAM-dependent methyltransferase